MNIRLRLTLWYTTVLILILAVFGAAVYLGLSRSLIASLDNHLQREAGQLIGGMNFEDHEEPDEPTSHVELSYRPEEGVLWRVLDRHGRLLIDPGYLTNVPIDPSVITLDYARFEYAMLDNGTPLRLYSVPFVIEGGEGGIAQVAESYAQIREVEYRLVWMLALGIPFTLLAASAGGWFLASRALNPIDRITRAAQQISADDLHQRLDLKLPNDEVGRLAVTFDQMLARLDDAFERQKRFIADASHELRTPLTILKGDVEVALNRPRQAAEYRETLEMVNQTTDRLTSLVEELFLLARADNHQQSLQFESFNLTQLLNQQVAKLKPRAASKNIVLSLNAPDDSLNIVADPAKLTRLFINLIDNAIKYSNPGDIITVTAAAHDGQVRVAIADTGPGIPPHHLDRLFERFYRVDKARSRQAADPSDSSGAGLGLSIADWLAKAHEGRIEVNSQVGQGSTFTVWLPFAPAAWYKNL